MTAAIMICARLASRRVPNKCAIEIAGRPILRHLHDRLTKAEIPITVAVPAAEYSQFLGMINEWKVKPRLYAGHDHDPMLRMLAAAEGQKLDYIVRITHDKIFVDVDRIQNAIRTCDTGGLDYWYSSGFTPGTQFEVISVAALRRACMLYRNVEHVSYAIRTVCKSRLDVSLKPVPDTRLLIDFPEDIELMRTLFAILGPNCTLGQVESFMASEPWAREINRMPQVTVYTCALNAEQWVEKCMRSVVEQVGFHQHEYILVDDASTDRTAYLMAKFASKFPNVRYIRNDKNLGLASSSNVALSEARGKYVIRMDSDDYFTATNAIQELAKVAERTKADAVYPSNYHGSTEKVQKGSEEHHVGGAIFSTRALNHIKFTDGLRNHDGLDLFVRARQQLRIEYLNRAVFMYTQRPDSMSKTNLRERQNTRDAILSAMTGGPLITMEEADAFFEDIQAGKIP